MTDLHSGLSTDKYERTYGDAELFRRVASLLAPQAKLIIAIVFTAILGAIAGAISPVLMSRGIDLVLNNYQLDRIVALTAIVFIVGIVMWVLNFSRSWLSAVVVSNVLFAMRSSAIASVMNQGIAFFSEEPAGALVSRITNDTQSFSALIKIVVDFLGQCLLVAFVAIVLIFINPYLASITLGLALSIVLATQAFRRVARNASRAQQQTLARLNSLLQESLSGILIAKNFNQEKAMYKELTRANSQWFFASRRMNTILSAVFPLMFTITGLGTVAVVYTGGQRVLKGDLTIGEWFLFLQSVALFWGPLTSMTSFWGQFQQGLSAGSRVFGLIDAVPRVIQLSCQPIGKLQGDIKLEHVYLSYNNRESVLRDLSVHIRPGETIALVGHTGAGKSSVARLIARAIEFQQGTILVDDRDFRMLDLELYRRQLGIIAQVPVLFSGTVAENIRYARPGASDADILRIAQDVASGDWLQSLPQGLNSEVQEGGKNLSTGQRQLIALCRTLLQEPSILIMDEATANLDPLTEAQLQEGLDRVIKGRTSIIIAHRLPTVRKADRILVLRAGEILESGTHDSLIQLGGYYSQTYRSFFDPRDHD